MFSFGIILVAAATLASAKVAPIRPLDHQPLQLERGCHGFTDVGKEFLPMVFAQNGIVAPTQALDGGFTFKFPERGAKYSLVCPGENNHFKITGDRSLTVTCDLNGELKVDDLRVGFSDLVCAGTTGTNAGSATIARNGTCYNGYTKIDISFPTYTWIEICHNEAQSETVWTKNKIDGPNLDNAESPTRPPFEEADFYPDIDANACYTQVKQTETIGIILKSASLAADYIIPSQELYLARGHLVPNADGIPADERLATFYFVNAVPQWQIINGFSGNWLRLEEALRNYAKENQAILTVYTGAWGATTLKDIDGVPQELWLGRDVAGNLLKSLPVPRAYYKIALDTANGTGVAVIVINNPYEENFDPADVLCESICDQIPWVNWTTDDHRYGYTYCCRVADFYKAHSVIPDPGNPSLMV